MKFSKKHLLPLLTLTIIPFGIALAQSPANSPNAPEVNYNVTTPWPLEDAEDSKTSAAVPHLSLPVLPGEVRPWTGTDVHNNPQNFQIAIMTDRNGGNRPGIFSKAVGKINLLQPEFVMSIGDLIQGYTDDHDTAVKMWEEFEEVVSHLEMPFFYVAGNHDITNKMLTEEWHRRFGPTYYHFRYADVLFLCLNTDDGEHWKISQEQVDYFRNVLEENQDVRWTLVFMHKPVWSNNIRSLSDENEADLKRKKETRFWDIQQMLQGRNHTIFAGHVHAYTKYEQNGYKYYSLATTGGGSGLRGAQTYGQFDHIVWLTMTDEGPVFANLALDGILPEDLRIEEETVLVHAAQREAVKAEVTVTDPLPFETATVTLNLENPATRPLTLNFTAPGKLKFEPEKMKVELGPKEKKTVEFKVDGSNLKSTKDLEGLGMSWTGTYKIEGRADVKLEERVTLHFDAKTAAKPASQEVSIDGDDAEWENLWSPVQTFREIDGSKNAWAGTDDVSFRYATQYDDKNLYVAIRVKDDDIVTEALSRRGFPDAVRLFILPEGAEEDSDERIIITAHPAKSGAGSVKSKNETVNGACQTTEDGYVFEAAIPAENLKQGAGSWEAVRMNVQINDSDDVSGSRNSKQWWRPQWDSSGSYPQSGTIIRGE